MAQDGALTDLLALAGHKQHLERERALGRIEELFDAAGEAHMRLNVCKSCPRNPARPRMLLGTGSVAHPRPFRLSASAGDAGPLLAEAADGVRTLVASAEWEQRLGGLRLARVVLQRQVLARCHGDAAAVLLGQVQRMLCS